MEETNRLLFQVLKGVTCFISRNYLYLSFPVRLARARRLDHRRQRARFRRSLQKSEIADGAQSAG